MNDDIMLLMSKSDFIILHYIIRVSRNYDMINF